VVFESFDKRTRLADGACIDHVRYHKC
jgi:hypothetical protein